MLKVVNISERQTAAFRMRLDGKPRWIRIRPGGRFRRRFPLEVPLEGGDDMTITFSASFGKVHYELVMPSRSRPDYKYQIDLICPVTDLAANDGYPNWQVKSAKKIDDHWREVP